MAEKSRWTALLTGDHRQLAEIYRREGNKQKALEAYAKAGEWRQAGRLALELKQPRAAVEHFLVGALGNGADAYHEASAEQAAELLVSAGHREEAILLFESVGAYRKAANAALKVRDLARAAGLFEKGRDLDQAALYYERLGRFEDALRVIETQIRQAIQQAHAKNAQGIDPARKELDARRAEMLAQLGRTQEAVTLLRALGHKARAARLLQEAGQIEPAIEAYLDAGDVDSAQRLVTQTHNLDPRLLVRIAQGTGQSAKAARLLAGLGEVQEAAQAYEEAGDWASAAREWHRMRDFPRAATAFFRAGQFGEAGRFFELAGDWPRAAESYLRDGDRAKAASAFQKAGRFFEAAESFLAVGDKTKAARALQMVPTNGPEFRPATLLLVPLLLEEGLPGVALQRLRMLAPETVPGSDQLDRLYWEGRVQESLGQDGEAADAYQKLIALRRDFRDATDRLTQLSVRLSVLRPAGPGTFGPGLEPTLREGAALLAPAAPRPVTLGPGALVAGRYEIHEELGRGGMGCVYSAFDRELKDKVAIKTVLTGSDGDGREMERLVREVQICRRITHPNVVRVYDLGRFEGGIFISMELLEGVGLDSLIGRGKQLSLSRVRSIVSEVLAGLGEAHNLGIVHRDLKPSNLFLTARHLKILDFGIARMAESDPHLTRTGFAVGTPLYMSPEQVRGEALDGRSDLYSLGVLVFTLLVGREPFPGPGAGAIVLDHLQNLAPDPGELRAGLPPPWSELVVRLLAKAAGERLPSAQAVAEALARLPVEG